MGLALEGFRFITKKSTSFRSLFKTQSTKALIIFVKSSAFDNYLGSQYAPDTPDSLTKNIKKKKKIVQEYESCVTVNISFTGDVFQWFLVHKNLLWLLKNATGQPISL